MNSHLRILAGWLVTGGIVGCGPSSPHDDRARTDVSERQLDDATFSAGLDPSDTRIVALVSWLKHKGVTLEYTGSAEGGGWWKVVQPKTPADYDVVFSIRSFPAWASEKQMREALDINLAYQLNAPAHLAMSFGGCTGTQAEAELPKTDEVLPMVNGVPVTQAVEQWFMEYKHEVTVKYFVFTTTIEVMVNQGENTTIEQTFGTWVASPKLKRA